MNSGARVVLANPFSAYLVLGRHVLVGINNWDFPFCVCIFSCLIMAVMYFSFLGFPGCSSDVPSVLFLVVVVFCIVFAPISISTESNMH